MAPTPSTVTPTIGPLSGDGLDILILHDRWATSRILDFCSEIAPDALHARHPIGPGSLHDTLTHIIGAGRRWADRIDGLTPRPSIEIPEGSSWSYFAPSGPKPAMPRRTLAQLRALHEETAHELVLVARRARSRGLHTPFRVVMGKDTYTFSLGAALAHVATHAVHHRAQCMVMLRLSHAPCFKDSTPEIGVADWQVECETFELAPYRPAPFAAQETRP